MVSKKGYCLPFDIESDLVYLFFNHLLLFKNANRNKKFFILKDNNSIERLCSLLNVPINKKTTSFV